MKARYIVKAGEREHLVEIREVGDEYEIMIDDEIHRVDSARLDGAPVRSLLIEGQSYEVNTVQEGDRIDVYLEGEIYPVDVYDELWARAREGKVERGTDGEEIQAPIPGSVVKLMVAVGDTVAPGTAVAVLEAMKMQNELVARNGGVVTEIKAAVGDTVAQGQALVVLEPAG